MHGMNGDFQRLLDEAVAFHGHLCGGQIIGVRMAMAALRELGIRNPRSKEGRDLVVFVEIDRCATDAIISVTGRTPGKRSIKILDYGKMAATFVNTDTGQAVRVSARADSREKADKIAEIYRAEKGEKEANLHALTIMRERDLFDLQWVRVVLKPQDLPGEPLDTVVCEKCGESVKDMREVVRKGRTLCKPCAAGEAYYRVLDTCGEIACSRCCR
jgi:formylmethanofuran dehydrogenase subunit E